MNIEEMKARLTAAYINNHDGDKDGNDQTIGAVGPSIGSIGSVEVFDLTGGQNHWEVHIESQAFRGLTRIQQHQHVMNLFKDELKSNCIHALSIKTKIKE